MMSDINLKSDIIKIGEQHGLNVYSWDWNLEAEEKFGMSGRCTGYMAHEVALVHPHAVGVIDDRLCVYPDKILEAA